MADLMRAVCARSALSRAWEHVRSRDEADGELAPSVARFASAEDANLEALATALRSGTWSPHPTTEVEIPKSDGGVRLLNIPVAEDRIVERALATAVAPIVDPWLSPSSFAYREGLGVLDAVRLLASLRDEGHPWVVRTDIDDCFDSIDRLRACEAFDRCVSDTAVRDLVRALVHRPVRHRRGVSERLRGVPQGSSLSPLLANLLTDEVDRRVAREGLPMVRFADDIVVLAGDRAEAEAGLELVVDAAEEVDLRLGADKTEIVSFDEGFSFLGEDFGPRYPVVGDHDRRSEPERRTLYVGRQGAYVRISSGRIEVAKGDEEILSVPSGQVARIVLFGSVGLTSGARSWALSEGVAVVLVSRRGWLLGRVEGPNGGDVRLRRAQLRASEDPSFALDIARQMVFGKISNQRALLMRFGRRSHREVVPGIAEELDALRTSLPNATSTAELMGVEGFASRRYFEALRALLPDEVDFDGRSRRPPGDVVNAALSYGYAVITGEAVTACAAAGLDSEVGFLHADDPNRASLALDLVEEMRPLVVDTVVLDLFRRKALTAAHSRVESDRPGVLLTDAGRRVLLARLEDRLLTVVKHPVSGTRTSYRRALHLQAAQVAAIVRGERDTYTPMGWR